MVAIVSGVGLGLNLTSQGVLGGQGSFGDPSVGQGNEKVVVNAATGNLVLQQLQDAFVGLGPEFDSVLTYNSQGTLNGVNGYQFTTGAVTGQLFLGGTQGQAGSTVTVTEFDGSQEVYTWDATGARYTSTAGGGAYDTITYSATTGQYTRVAGSSQQTETYDATSGRLLARADAQGNTITFAYAGGRLQGVSHNYLINGHAQAETVNYVYDTNNKLVNITKTTNVVDANGNPTPTTQTLVTYGYTSNHLVSVAIDLTPANGADSSVYTTTFAYDAQNRVKTMSQTDGTSLSFVYESTAPNRIASIADALGNVTAFSYVQTKDANQVVTSTTTTVTLNGSKTATYVSDGANQLTSVTLPAALSGGADAVTRFGYDANGNLTSIVDAANRSQYMGYDARGNLVSKRDADGGVTLYTYDARNQLVTQTTSTLAIAAMTNVVGMTVSGGTVTKGATTGWDGAAYSANAVAGGAAVSFTAGQTSSDMAVGLTANPTGVGYASFDWAIYCVAGATGATSGTLKASENGTLVDLGATYTTGDTLSVRYDGIQVTYLKNGAVLRSVAASLDDPLSAAVSIQNAGARLDNLRFGAVTNDDGEEVDLQGVPLLTATAGMTVSGDNVQKNGTTSNFDASVYSKVGLTGGAVVSFTASSSANYLMVGLDSAPSLDASEQTLDFAAYLSNGTLYAVKDGHSLALQTGGAQPPTGVALRVLQAGDPAVSLGAYRAGDRFSVVYDGATTVSWLLNGKVVGTYTLTSALSAPLYLDSSFANPGAGVMDLRFGGFGAVDPVRQRTAPVMVNAGGVLVDGGTLTKTGGLDGHWDSSARSALGLSGGAQVAFTVPPTGKALCIGLGGDPAAGIDPTAIDYSFRLNADNTLEAWAGGAKLSGITLPNYAPKDRLEVRSDGVNVTWTVNGVVKATTALVGSSLQPLHVEAVFCSSLASVSDLLFDSGNPVAEATALPIARLSAAVNVSSTSTGTVTKNAGVDGTWDAGVRSTNGIVGGAAVAVTAAARAKYAIGLSTQTSSSTDWRTIDYAMVLQANGAIWSYQDGLNGVQIGTYKAGDRLSVVYDGDHVTWRQNGKTIATMNVAVTAPLYAICSLAGANATVNALSFGSSDMADPFADGDAPPLKATAGVTVSGGDVTKTGGTDGSWDSSARSVYGYTGGATVSFTAETPGNGLVVGLNTNPDSSANYQSIAYGFILQQNGTVGVVESGTVTPLNLNYSPGDRFSVSYDGRQVVYVMNGQVVRATAVATPIALPIYLDTSFRDAGGKISDLNFTGGASTDQTTRYVYDDAGKGLLRYTISAAGRVTEYGYDATGALVSTNDYVQASYSMVGLASSVVPSENDLNTWRAMQDLTLTQRTDIQRDWRKQVSATVTHATTAADGSAGPGASLTTSYVRDAAGRLLQQVAPGGVTTTYVYDGLGRVVSVTDPLNRLTTTSYADASGQVTVTRTVGAVTQASIETFDKAGRLTSVATWGTGLGSTQTPYATTKYDYDAAGHLLRTTDPTGVKTWSLYDAEGRKVADIDGEGVLTGYDRDASGLVTRTWVHATKLDAATLAKLVDPQDHITPINPSLATLGIAFDPTRDRVSWNVYDGAGQLRQTIDALGAVTQYDYDGAGRLVATTAFARMLDPAAIGSAPVQGFRTIAASADDHVTRHYYDADGLLVGTLDPDRYLTTYEYDGAGRLAVTTRWATQVPGTNVASTLDEIAPAPAVDDQRSVTLYDAAGRVTGQVDAEGYLTASTYDAKGNLATTTRYAAQVGTAVAPGASVAGITPTASTDDRSTTYLYDADDRLQSVANYEGMVTLYGYAAIGDQVVSTDVAHGHADARQTQRRLDSLGRVTAELSGVGSALITSNSNQSQIDAVWAQYGVDYAYDAAGRRISMTDARNDTTYYYYDNDGRLAYSIDAARAVTGYQYDAFGQVVETDRYPNPVATTQSLGSGGLVSQAPANLFANLGTPVGTKAAYLLDGLAKSVTDAMGYTTTNASYDAFGDVLVRTTALAAGGLRTDAFTYDHRGDALTSVMDQGTGRLGITASSTYDAFGRQVTHTDGNGQLVNTSYDRLGDVIQRTDPLAPASTWLYDAFGQVKSWSRNGADPTTYVYGNTGKSVTATPPGLAGTTTVHDSLGRVSSVTDANGKVTAYGYDADGHLTRTTVNGVATFAASYDAAGNLVTSQDGLGIVDGKYTHYTYDADNRLEFVVDADNGVTKHEYDALGREVRVTRFVNRAQALTIGTTTVAVANDASAIARADVNVQATPKVDQVDARVYDAAGRVVWEVDGTGAATKTTYGDGNAVLQRTRFANPIVLAGWDISQAPAVTSSVDDRTERWSYDALGRVTLAVDASGSATGYTYDANGNVTQACRYANPVPGALRVDGSGGAAVLWLGTYPAGDVVTATVRFKADPSQSGRLSLGDGSDAGHGSYSPWTAGTDGWVTMTVSFTVGAAGSAHPNASQTLSIGLYSANAGSVLYDNLHVTDTRAGATSTVFDTSFDNLPLGTGVGQWSVTGTTGLPVLSPDPAHDRVTRKVYDADGRVALSVDPAGAATQFAYDADGNVTQVRQLATPVPASDVLADSDKVLLAKANSLANDANDLVSASLYDANDRMTAQVDAAGAVTGYTYDANGNVTQLVQFATLVPGAGAKSSAALQAALAPVLGHPDHTVDRVTRRGYDGLDRLSWSADPTGAVTQYGYDASGNLTSNTRYATPLDFPATPYLTLPQGVTTGGSLVSRFVYDAANRETLRADPRGAVTGTTYDGAGNATSRTQYLAPDTNLTHATVKTPSSSDRTTLMSYDGAGRVSYVSDPLRFVTGYAYDAFGDETATTRYFARLLDTSTSPNQVTPTSGSDLTTSQSFDGSGRLTLRNDGGLATRYAYDNFGQLAWTVAADGGVTHAEYDADGRVLRTTRYATAMDNPDQLGPQAEAGMVAWLASLLAAPAHSVDSVTLNQYDGFGRLRYSRDGAGAFTETRYDAAGNVTERIGYADVPTAAWNGVDTPPITPDAAADRHVRMAYDAFGDVVTSLTAGSLAVVGGTSTLMGALVVNAYDGAGRLTDRTRYANAIVFSSWTSGQQPAFIPDATRDIHEQSHYDGYGRLDTQTDGTGAVTALVYDASGHVAQRVLKDPSGNSGGDRTERFTFDIFGEQTLHSDPTGAITKTDYDAAGHAIARTQFFDTSAGTGDIVAPTADAALNRTTKMAYDGFGRLHYVTDPLRYVTMTTYDAHDRVAYQVAFQSSVGVPTDPQASLPWDSTVDERTAFTYDAVGRVLTRIDAGNGLQAFQYDGQGNKIQFTDEKSQVWSYSYDADGREKSETSPTVTVTTVAKNAAGDLQNDADQTVKLVKQWRYDGLGNATQCIEGIYQNLDAAGNAKLDANGNLDQNTDHQRKTSYAYDAAGRLTLTTLPQVPSYDENDAPQKTDDGSWQLATRRIVYDTFGNVAATIEPGASTAVYRTYDQANRLAFTIDTGGNIVGYARDVFGEVTKQTAYAASPALTENVAAPGQQADQEAINTANLPQTAHVRAQIAAFTAPAGTPPNRVTTNTYYANGLLKSTAGSAGSYYGYDSTRGIYSLGPTATATPAPRTEYTYDAFGELIQQAVLIDARPASGFYANTLHFYDACGNETDTVVPTGAIDESAGAVPSGYLTQRVFDAFGNVTKITEWAKAASGWVVGAVRGAQPGSATSVDKTAGGAGGDRVTTVTYDTLNRKISQTRRVGWVQDGTDLTAGVGDLTDSWVYDKQGHVIYTEQGAAVDAGLAGTSTFTMYDALGQVRAVIQPWRTAGLGAGSAALPITEYAYDAFGNVTAKIEHVNSATNVSRLYGVWTSGGTNGYSVVAVNNASDPNNSDHVTRTLHDSAGRVIQVDDTLAATSAGHNILSRYDLAGRLVYSQHVTVGNDNQPVVIYQRYSYDPKSGRLVHAYAPPSGNGSADIRTDYEYDAFGDVVVKGIDGGRQEFFQYNANGQLWRTNSGDGVVHVYLHDLAGNVTSDLSSKGLGDGNGSNVDVNTLASEADAFNRHDDLRAVNTVRDMAGNAVVVAQPSRAVNLGGGVGVVAGNTSWSATVSNNVTTLKVSFPDVSALGSGEFMFEVAYTAGDGSSQVFRAYEANWYLHPTWSQFALPTGVTQSSITSVTVSKKMSIGGWQPLNGYAAGSQGLVRTQVFVTAPDDSSAALDDPSGDASTKRATPSVVLSYVQGSSAVTPALVNFGDAYWFDASSLASGTYSYTVTITGIDGSVTNSTGSFTIGQAKAPPASTSTITPTTNQVFDRWGNLVSRSDPRNAEWLTSYAYDANDQVISEYDTSKNGNSLITTYSYDRAGNRVAVTDALHRVSVRKFDSAGHVIETDQHSDSADLAHTLVKTISRYDIFGRLVQSIAADGYDGTGSAAANIDDYTTQYTYDALGHLLAQQEGIGAGSVMVVRNGVGTMQNLQQAYTYDADGNRLSSWDGTVSADGRTRELTLYSYDAAGHLASTTLPATAAHSAAVTTYQYDDFGHLTRETDADKDTATWYEDYFGRFRTDLDYGHKDFVGATYKYTYDNAGQLVTQTSTAAASGSPNQSLHYSFDAAGQLMQVRNDELAETTTYAYDAAGRQVRESTAVGGSPTVRGQIFQDNHLSYDEHGRLVVSWDDASKVSFGYDAVGNRLYVGVYLLVDGMAVHMSDPAIHALNRSSTHYFSYDDMNRQINVNWQSADTQGDDGHVLTYDADGNRTSDTFSGNVVWVHNMPASSSTDALYDVPIYGTLPTGYLCKANARGSVTESYSYDAADRLSQTFYSVSADGVPTDVVIDSRRYDAAGRVTNEGTNGHLLSGLADQITLAGTFQMSRNYVTLPGRDVDFETHVNTYDERGQLLNGLVRDQMGNVIANNVDVPTTTLSPDGTSESRTVHTTMTVVAGEHYETTQESSHVTTQYRDASNSLHSSDSSTTSTTTSYDASGRITSIVEADNAALDRHFVYDDQGRVLRTLSGEAASGQNDMRELVVAGEVLGQYGVKVTPNNTGSTDAATFTQVDEFDFGYEGLDDPDYDTSSSVTTAGANESFFGLAASAYGNSGLAGRVAQANGMSSHAQLQAGMRVTIAGKSGASHNDQDSFAAYDPRAMIGTQSPTINLPQEAVSRDAQNQLYMNRYGMSVDSAGAETPLGSSSGAVSQGSYEIPTDQRENSVSFNEYNGPTEGEKLVAYMTHAMEYGGGKGLAGFQGTATWGSGGAVASSDMATSDSLLFPSVGEDIGITFGDGLPDVVAIAFGDGGSSFDDTSNDSGNTDDNGAQWGFGDRNTTSVGDLWSGPIGGDLLPQGVGPYSDVGYLNGADIGNAGGMAGSPAFGVTPNPNYVSPAQAFLAGPREPTFAENVATNTAANAFTPENVARMDATLQANSITVGTEGAEGLWGVSKSLLPNGAGDAQIQQGVLQLMTANPGKTTLQLGDRLSLGNGSIASAAVQTYAGMDASYQAGLVQRLTTIASNASAGAIASMVQSPMFAAPQLDTWIDSPFAGASFNDIAPSDTIRPADSGLNYVLADIKAAWNGKVSWSDAASMAWNIGGNEAVGAIGHGLTAGVAYTLAAASSWTGVGGVGFGLLALQQSDAAVTEGMNFLGLDDSPSYFDRGLSTMLSPQTVAAVDKEIDLAAGAISFGALSASEAAASASRIRALRMDPSNYAHTLDLLPSNWYDSPQAINIAPTPQNAEGLAELLANETSAAGASRGMAGVLIDQYGNVRFGLSAKAAAAVEEGGVNIPRATNQFMQDLTAKKVEDGYAGFRGFCAEPDAYSRFLNVSDLFDSENAVMGTAQIHEPLGSIRPACVNCAQVHQFFGVAYRDEAVGAWVTMPQSYSFAEARFSLAPSFAGLADPRDQNPGSPYHP